MVFPPKNIGINVHMKKSEFEIDFCYILMFVNISFRMYSSFCVWVKSQEVEINYIARKLNKHLSLHLFCFINNFGHNNFSYQCTIAIDRIKCKIRCRAFIWSPFDLIERIKMKIRCLFHNYFFTLKNFENFYLNLFNFCFPISGHLIQKLILQKKSSIFFRIF